MQRKRALVPPATFPWGGPKRLVQFLYRKIHWIWVATSALIIYHTDTLVFAAPILFLTGMIGAWWTFAVLVVPYFLLDLWLGLRMLDLVSGKTTAKKRPLTWLQKWFDELQDSNIGKKVRKRLEGRTGVIRWPLFAAASYTGTAFLTIPFMWVLGERRWRLLRVLTGVSAAIYAISFVGQYAAVGLVLWTTLKLIAAYFVGLF